MYPAYSGLQVEGWSLKIYSTFKQSNDWNIYLIKLVVILLLTGLFRSCFFNVFFMYYIYACGLNFKYYTCSVVEGLWSYTIGYCHHMLCLYQCTRFTIYIVCCYMPFFFNSQASKISKYYCWKFMKQEKLRYLWFLYFLHVNFVNCHNLLLGFLIELFHIFFYSFLYVFTSLLKAIWL